ncbi:hypothetical protein HHL19_17530 [Streptomyces sp. R302]|uniref:hypothetical protein n=1 Tax=unclassified Streptomyces TaxID=2593676 RepID=UPI00145E7651|nr:MULTISPECIES: hypothetical protein [unclassified Streptomyces]NML52637.1 hypothetical protein [Streptomyces sp. R301]NML80434.1 hypothetical protein [Streptomyces sp. R302]
MKIESLLEDLYGDDPARAEAAAEEIVARGEELVPGLLAGAAGGSGSARLKPYQRALGLIGPAAFDGLVAAWRREEVSGWLANRLLTAFDERCADRYAELAASPKYGVAGEGFSGLLRLRTDSEAGLRALVACYAHGRAVPYKADDYARALHDAFRPRLRALRRDPGVPPRVRRGAMAALVVGGGADALDDRDRATVERLIRVKIPHETPALPSNVLSGWWMAVPAASYEGLFDALDLHDRRPVTCAAGNAASEGRQIRVPGKADGDRARSVGRVFVTPELDGWRLIFGDYDLLVGDDWDDITDTVERLSTHCGQAQFFFLDDAGGSDVWMVAENGTVIRRFVAEGDPEGEGAPLPWETLAVDAPDYDPEYDDAPPHAGTLGARSACAHLSVDPNEIGPETRVRGHGWLAVTAPGVGHGAFPGRLPL